MRVFEAHFRLKNVLIKKTTSIWLTMIPIKRSSFFLEKQAFWDIIRIRCNILLERLPTLCVRGDSFNLQHALSCPKGLLVFTRLRNLTAEILGEVCKNVVIELLLTPLTGKDFLTLQIRATKQEQMCQLEGYGLMSRECSRFFSHTAERLASRRKEPKSKISAWIKARLNFALIRSMLLCLQGIRTP